MDTDTFKLLLTTSTYTPNQDTHDFRDDVTNEVAAGSGYSTGGVTLSGVAVTYDSATNETRIDFNDPSFAFVGSKTWRNGVVYKSRGGASSADELVAYLVWDSDQTVSTTYTIVLDVTGLVKITAT
jgi:hypothetical protein